MAEETIIPQRVNEEQKNGTLPMVEPSPPQLHQPDSELDQIDVEKQFEDKQPAVEQLDGRLQLVAEKQDKGKQPARGLDQKQDKGKQPARGLDEKQDKGKQPADSSGSDDEDALLDKELMKAARRAKTYTSGLTAAVTGVRDGSKQEPENAFEAAEKMGFGTDEFGFHYSTNNFSESASPSNCQLEKEVSSAVERPGPSTSAGEVPVQISEVNSSTSSESSDGSRKRAVFSVELSSYINKCACLNVNGDTSR